MKNKTKKEKMNIIKGYILFYIIGLTTIMLMAMYTEYMDKLGG